MPSFRERISAALKAWKTASAPASIRHPAPISLPGFRRASRPGSSQRSYAGAQYDRLTEDFASPLTTGDAEMRTTIRTLRGRARQLARNDPYTRRFLTRLQDNVYDHHGMTFTSLAGEWRRKDGRLEWKLDDSDKQVIEEAYAEWRKNPLVTGDMTANDAGRLALACVVRDGDAFVRPVIDPSVNKFAFALQLFEGDICDDYRNELARGIDGRVISQVRMGVEVDPYMRATAYWMLKEYPGDQQWWNSEGYWSERHAAAEYLHLFKRDRITQVRDVTWLTTIMRDLHMLNQYDEAAIVAARTGAAKMGFFTRDYNQAGAPYTGETGNDSAMGGDKSMDAEPGLIEDLSQSPGLKFTQWDPAYPHEQYDPFIKTRLRRIGAGLDMSYYAMANDLTEVNFSSIRAGLLEDRERFKALQSWWINLYETPVFLKWLEVQLVMGTLKDPVTTVSLPFSKLEKFQRHRFRPRRWPWVDPEKDVAADKLAVDNLFKSRTDVVEENSQKTFREVVREHEEEQTFAEEHNVKLPQPDGAQPEPDGDEGDGEKGGSDKKPNGKSPAKKNGARGLEPIVITVPPASKAEPAKYNLTRDDNGRITHVERS